MPLIDNLIHNQNPMSMPSLSLPELLTLKETAQVLRLSVSNVRKLIHKRTLPFYRVSRSLRFAKADIEAYLKTGFVERVDRDEQ